MKNKLVIIGLPGSGKTQLGKELAQALDLVFVDLDEEVEKTAGTTIDQIFKHAGEEEFRKIEAIVLRQQLSIHQGMVLATGGGTPCFHRNMHFIKLFSLSLYLEIGFEELAERLQDDTQRPLLAGMERENMAYALEHKFGYRIPFYQKADLTFRNSKGADWRPLQEEIRKQLILKS